MLARVSKANPWKVVCGVRDCGAHLTYILLSRQSPPRRWLVMGWDWAPRYSDRVWAKRRERARGKVGLDHGQFWFIRALPVDIVCQECGLRQTLSNENLHVDAEDSATFAGIPTTCRTPRCRGQSLSGEACPECQRINTRRPEPGHPMEPMTFESLLAATVSWYATSNGKTE